MILSVEFSWIGETSAGINVHKCAELLLVVRIDHVKTVWKMVQAHWIGNGEVWPRVRLTELKGAMSSIEQHIVLDCLETSAGEVTQVLPFILQYLSLGVMECFYFFEKRLDHWSILPHIFIQLGQLSSEGIHVILQVTSLQLLLILLNVLLLLFAEHGATTTTSKEGSHIAQEITAECLILLWGSRTLIDNCWIAQVHLVTPGDVTDGWRIEEGHRLILLDALTLFPA